MKIILCKYIKLRHANFPAQIFTKSTKRLSACMPKLRKNQNAGLTFGQLFLTKKKFSLIYSGIICLKNPTGETGYDGLGTMAARWN